jgi:hypothetical protein
VLEVDPSLINEAAVLLQMSMEDAASLLGMCSILSFFKKILTS